MPLANPQVLIVGSWLKLIVIKGNQGKVDLKNQSIVKEKNAGREIVDSASSGSSCVDIDATRRPPGSDSWKLIRIDRSDPSILIGKSYSDFFIVSDYQQQDFELAWQAFSGSEVQSGISKYCSKRS